MPIHDVGYRAWKGHITSTWTRWWTISEAGITTVFTSRWIRRIVLASWFPVIYFGILFFFFEKTMEKSGSELINQFMMSGEFSEIAIRQDDVPTDAQSQNGISQDGVQQNDEPRDGVPRDEVQKDEVQNDEVQKDLVQKDDDPEDGIITNEDIEAISAFGNNVANQARLQSLRVHPLMQMIPNSEALIAAIDTGDDSVMRNTTWNLFLATFLRYPQGLMTLMIIGLIVPPLISRDVRSRAFLLYYSRPITRMEYLLGKLAIPGFVLMTVTLVPAIALYFFGLMLSPNLMVVFDTWDTPFRIVLATAVCVIPTSLIGLLFSSMTQESRFAGFAWFSIWGLGAVVWWVIFLSNSNGGQVPFESNWSLISLYATIGRVQAWVFGLETDVGRVLPSIIMLGMATVFSFIGLYRRVSAPVRI